MGQRNETKQKLMALNSLTLLEFDLWRAQKGYSRRLTRRGLPD